MKLITWLMTALLLAVCGMGLVYNLQRQEYGREQARIDRLWEREAIAQDLTHDLEKYRRLSGQFRRQTEHEISATKANLTSEIAKGTGRLDQLDPTADEKVWSQKLKQQLDDFMELSAKLEPMLFLRDVYLKPEAVSSHEAMLGTLRKLKDSASSQHQVVRAQASAQAVRLQQALYGLIIVSFALAFLTIARLFLAYVRPIRQVLARVRDVKAGKLRRDKVSRLRGTHAEIEKAVDDLAALVDAEQRERQHFVTAVATDLRVPLIPLQTSANLLASVNAQLSDEQKHEASEAVRRSVARLSRTLEDLTDTLQLEAGSISLTEKIVDLRDVLTGASSMLSGPGSSHDVRASVPTTPVWALVDRQRLERVIINLISKVMQYSPQGGWVDLVLSKASRSGSPNGVEIIIHQGSNAEVAGNVRPTGPEQDLLRHWISENGFGLALAKKIVEAHGGSITAAGIAGTSVVFTLRLPEERIANSIQGRAGFKTVLGDLRQNDTRNISG